VAYFSEGIETDTSDYINNRDAASVASAIKELLSSAMRANVVIYCIDPRGLTSLGDELIEAQGVPINPHANLGMGSLPSELQRSQDSLRVLAEQTGGFAALGGTSLQEAFHRIAAESSQYYVLGYYSTNQRRDGRFRTIAVRSTRPGLIVRARKGYVAPSASRSSRTIGDRSASAELATALDSALPTSGIPLRAAAAAFKGASSHPTITIALEITGRDLAFSRRGGTFEDVIEFSVAAVDASGMQRETVHRALTVELGADAYNRFTEVGLRLLSRLSLPPGRYQLRMAARDTANGALGTVFHDIDVPDFSAAALSMSHLVLTSVSGTTTPTVRVEQESLALPVLPSAAREFTANDELILFAEIYDRASEPHGVDTTTTVRTAEGRTVFRHHQESVSGGSESAGGFGYVARIRLQDMPPGAYVVTVDAVSRLSNDGRATRQVPFRIRP
jgi:hypothetical protein